MCATRDWTVHESETQNLLSTYLHTYVRPIFAGSREDHRETIWNKSLIASLAANSFHAVLHV